MTTENLTIPLIKKQQKVKRKSFNNIKHEKKIVNDINNKKYNINNYNYKKIEYCRTWPREDDNVRACGIWTQPMRVLKSWRRACSMADVILGFLLVTCHVVYTGNFHNHFLLFILLFTGNLTVLI